MMTLVTTSLCSSQASATRAIEAPCAAAIGCMTSRMSNARSLSIGGKSNVLRRASVAPPERVNLPVRKPPASGLQTSSPRPWSRSSGMVSRSSSRPTSA